MSRRKPLRMRNARNEVVLAFYIGELAARLQKSASTLRRWQRLGLLPPTPLLHDVKGGSPRRLYTQQMIDGIAEIAEEEGLIGRRPARMADTAFRARCHDLFWELFPAG